MRRLLTLALMVPLAGCGGGDTDVDFGGDEIGEDRFSVLSRDGEIKMGLTEEFVYFALSEAALEEARSEMEEELGDGEGLGGMIGGMVQKGVEKALTFRAKYPVAEIEAIRWTDGEMEVVFTDGDRRVTDNLKVDDRPVTEAFAQEDVEAFSEAFRAVKSGGASEG
jgi:hypothetical protein